MPGRNVRLVAGILLLLYAWGIGSFLRVPYLLLQPGSAADVMPLLTVDGAPSYPPRGELLFLTVTLSGRVSPLRGVVGWLDDDAELVKEEKIVVGHSREDLRRINLAMMEDSKLTAMKVALERVGYPVQVRGGGAVVEDVVPGSPADGVLQTGDLVVGVDGADVGFTQDVVKAVRAHQPGERVSVVVKRDGAEKTLEVGTVEGDKGVAQVGIRLSNANVDFDFPFDVDIDTGEVGGPSAGLAFTLALIDRLTEGELTGGHKVAVTGSILLDGSVEAVGGVAQKAVAARHAGAVLFLVPKGEEAEARAHAGGLEVVGVDTIEDALAALARHGGNGLALPPPPPR